MIEAMALECRLVASDTLPVREVVRDGENGLLFPFFERDALVERVGEVLADRERAAGIAREARRTAVEAYDFRSVCLPQWRRFLAIT
jgi:glycosyltransferase involved in cell wall biosynthesis